MKEDSEGHAFPSFPKEEEVRHPSLLQRTIRTLLTPVLLGSAIAATTLPLPMEGEEPIKEERKEKDPALAKLRQEISSLVIDLDSNQYRVREQAQRRLTHVTTEWVTTRQKPFPLLPLLQPTKKHSLEQSQRLQRVLAAHEHEELQLLWRPTMVTIPPQWQGRDRPMLTDVLRELSSQTGYHLVQSRLRTQEELQQQKIAFPEGEQKTFWEVGKTVQDGVGHLEWDVRSNNVLEYNYSPVLYQCACPRGAVVALLESYKRASVWFSVMLEPKLILGGVTDVRVDLRTEKGESFSIYLQSEGPLRQTARLLPPVTGAERGAFHITATIIAYESVTVPIEDLQKEQDVQTAHGVFRYLRCSDGGGWQEKIVESRVVKGAEDQGESQLNMVRFQALDARGALLPSRGGTRNGGGGFHIFVGEPARVQFIVPRRQTTKTLTFEFPSVPLPKQ